jgi:hypothetical protein
MTVDRRSAIVAVCVIAASITSCKKDVTAPVIARTYSVTATGQVPAVPTAPVTIATNDTASHVSATLSVTQLQAIVAAAGGPVTIAMTDVGSADYATLPADVLALVKPDAIVIVFSTTLTNGGAINSSATVDIDIPVTIHETAEQAAAPFFTITPFSESPTASVVASARSASQVLSVSPRFASGVLTGSSIGNHLDANNNLLTSLKSNLKIGPPFGLLGFPASVSSPPPPAR